jgi:hypothetical protein
VIAFLSVEMIANATEMIEASAPTDSESLVIRSDDGVVGTDSRGRTDLHYGPGVEALAFLALPHFPDVRILPFAAPSLAHMKLKDFFLENIGIRGPTEQALVRAAVLFVEVDDPSDVRAANYPKHGLLRNLKGDYTGAHGGNIAVLGTTVASARHQSQRMDVERKESIYDSGQRVKGLVFVGLGVHVKSMVLDRQFLYEAKLEKEFRDLKAFFGGQTAGNRFAFIFTGIAGDFDGKLRQRFREDFPKIPLLGTRTKGAVFGNPCDTSTTSESRSLLGADLQLGDLVGILAVVGDPHATAKALAERKKRLFTAKKREADTGRTYYRRI